MFIYLYTCIYLHTLFTCILDCGYLLMIAYKLNEEQGFYFAQYMILNTENSAKHILGAQRLFKEWKQFIPGFFPHGCICPVIVAGIVI